MRRVRSNPFKLTCFGTGDGWPCADRGHSSFHYQLGRNNLLIDCGESVSRSYKAAGFAYDALDAVLLSHLHCDHIGGFFMFMQGLWLEQRRKNLPIHLPEDGIRPIRELLQAGMIFDELLAFKPEYVPLQPAVPFKVGGVKVTAFRTTHLDSLRGAFQSRYPLDFAAYSFLLETRGRRVAHSADIGHVDDLEPLLAKPVDLLVCELAHVQPAELFACLRGRPIGQIVFMHVAREYRNRLGLLARQASRSLGGIPCKFANDGLTVTL